MSTIFKPTKLGAQIARKLRAAGIDLVFDDNQHRVVRDDEAIQRNVVDGMDYWTWWLADQFGHAHVRQRLPDGEEWIHEAQIGSPIPATRCARAKQLHIERDGWTIGIEPEEE